MISRVEIFGDLKAESAECSAYLSGKGGSCDLLIHDLPTGNFRKFTLARLDRFIRFLETSQRAMQSAQLTLNIIVGGITIARVGAGARPGLISNLVSRSGFELRTIAIIRKLF